MSEAQFRRYERVHQTRYGSVVAPQPVDGKIEVRWDNGVTEEVDQSSLEANTTWDS